MTLSLQCNRQLHCGGFGVNRVCSAYIHDRVMLERHMRIASKSAAAKPGPAKPGPAKPRSDKPRSDKPGSDKPASAKPKRRAARGPPPAARSYHHGYLRRVLIDAAAQLAEEGGAEAVSVREAARRAGVSPGAPFRHFPSRDALMTAVAEEAQRRFRAEIDVALATAPAGDPLARFRCFGLAYLRWAMRNPPPFEILFIGRFFVS